MSFRPLGVALGFLLAGCSTDTFTGTDAAGGDAAPDAGMAGDAASDVGIMGDVTQTDAPPPACPFMSLKEPNACMTGSCLSSCCVASNGAYCGVCAAGCSCPTSGSLFECFSASDCGGSEVCCFEGTVSANTCPRQLTPATSPASSCVGSCVGRRLCTSDSDCVSNHCEQANLGQLYTGVCAL